jgi:hypothetical protein
MKRMIKVNVRRLGVLPFVLCGMIHLQAQEIADSVFWVYFKDKAGNGYTVDRPWE